jgi:hypothetical protein
MTRPSGEFHNVPGKAFTKSSTLRLSHLGPSKCFRHRAIEVFPELEPPFKTTITSRPSPMSAENDVEVRTRTAAYGTGHASWHAAERDMGAFSLGEAVATTMA